MPEPTAPTRPAEFERQVGELIRRYARAADQPFDAVAISGVAALGAHRSGRATGLRRLVGPSLRTAWLLLALLALLAALVGGALLVGGPTRLQLGPRFPSDELLVTTTNRDGNAVTVAVTVATGERRTVADGLVIAISPDRTRFVRSEPSALVISDARGNDLVKTGPASSVTWSPDSRFVLLTELGYPDRFHDRPAGYAIWDAASGAMTPLPFAPYVRVGGAGRPIGGLDAGLPSWAPDSRHLLLPTARGLVIADLNGGAVGRIGGSNRDSVGYWSPDGGLIVHEQRDESSLALLSVGPDFTTELVAELSAGSPRYPAWSPDGSKLAFLTDDGVVIANRDELRDPRVVFRGGVIDGPHLRWAPDGGQLAFVAWAQNGETHWLSHALYTVDTKGGEARVVVSPYGVGWPDGFDW